MFYPGEQSICTWEENIFFSSVRFGLFGRMCSFIQYFHIVFLYWWLSTVESGILKFIIIINYHWLCCVVWGILDPCPQIRPVPSAVEVQNANHWTPGEFLLLFFCLIVLFPRYWHILTDFPYLCQKHKFLNCLDGRMFVKIWWKG